MARTDPPQRESPAAVATLPLIAVSLADHWSNDLTRFWRMAVGAPDVLQLWKAESDLDFRLYRDYMAAAADLWMLPLKVIAAVTEASRLGDDEPAAKLFALPD